MSKVFYNNASGQKQNVGGQKKKKNKKKKKKKYNLNNIKKKKKTHFIKYLFLLKEKRGNFNFLKKLQND